MTELDPRERSRTFETKVASLIAATRHLEVPQILMLRRLTLGDPEARKWATDKQLNVVFAVILTKAVERTGLDRIKAARERGFDGLLPPGEDSRNEDLRVLSDITTQMLGPPVMTEAEATQNGFEKLLARGMMASPDRTIRPVATFREPPPLFAAQLGPPRPPLAKTMALPRPIPATGGGMSDEDGGDLRAEEPKYVDFASLFDETLCSYAQKTLAVFRVDAPSQGLRMPYLLAPHFGQIYTDVLRRFVLPGMRSTRHMQALATSYNWAEVGGEKIIEIIQGSEVNNPVLHNWDSRWAAFRLPKAPKGKKPPPPKPEDNPWPLFREDATRGNYEPPREDDLILLQDVIRYEADVMAKCWRELTQLYTQEFDPNGRQEQAREGALRDGIMKWVAKLPDHVGEHLAIKAHFEFPKVESYFLRRLVNSFGRTDADRRRNAPFLLDFVQQLDD